MNLRVRIHQNGYLKRKRRRSTKNMKRKIGGFAPAPDICVQTERTYCFTTVCNKTRRLLESFLEVVFEPLVLVLFGTQLHEFTWKNTDTRVQYMKTKERYSSVIKSW